ncbi:MAG: tRNA-dihydrouridine synthase [Thermoguttaceae bacterium]|nr:tRNA-dihydrouridine synthase [Thermoguttaceae bacterium]
MKRLSIGGVPVDPPLLSAPMAGYTTAPFRALLRYFGGVGLIATEMVSARSFVYMDAAGDGHPERLWGVAQEERPLVVQIWDNIPETLEETAFRLAHEYRVSIIDINFGCPARRIAKNSASGSYLLRNPEKVGDLVGRVARRIAPTPVTAKIRLGLTADAINAGDVAQAVEEAGGAAVTVHGRTAAQMYRGKADWGEIARVKESLKKIPLIGNGDITTPEEALDRLRAWPVDGIMIGRAAAARPWIFHQIAEGLAGRPIPPDPTQQEQYALLLRHFDLVLERFGEEKGTILMRKWACSWSHGRFGGRAFRAEISAVKTPAEFRKTVRRFFSAEENPPGGS